MGFAGLWNVFDESLMFKFDDLYPLVVVVPVNVVFMCRNYPFHSIPNRAASIQVLAVSVYNHYQRIYYETIQKWLVQYNISCLNLLFFHFFLSYRLVFYLRKNTEQCSLQRSIHASLEYLANIMTIKVVQWNLGVYQTSLWFIHWVHRTSVFSKLYNCCVFSFSFHVSGAREHKD